MTTRSIVHGLRLLIAVGTFVQAACLAETDTNEPREGASEKGVGAGNSAEKKENADLASVGVGSLCNGTTQQSCDPGLFCIGPPGVAGFCRAPAGQGQLCNGGTQPPCGNGLVCVGPPGVEGICRAPAGQGQLCGGGTQPPCASGLVCSGFPGSGGVCTRP